MFQFYFFDNPSNTNVITASDVILNKNILREYIGSSNISLSEYS